MANATLGKWGNANALRIPAVFCQELGIEAGSDVVLRLDGKRLIVEPTDYDLTIKGRMSNWNGERYNGKEVDWGEPQGDELW